MFIRRKVDCPHCGNEIMVNTNREISKCCWCRRIVKAKFTGNSKKHAKVEVEVVDFPKEQSFNSWKDEDIYGYD
jgi:hypothetical protein